MKLVVHRLQGAAIAALVAWFPLSATAYSLRQCLSENVRWKTQPVNLRASGVSFPAGAWRTALTDSVDAWNRSGANFTYSLTYDDAGVGFENGENEIWFSSDDADLSGAPAVSYSFIYCLYPGFAMYRETDILFDSREPWTTYHTTTNHIYEYGGPNRPFETTSMHELGHSLGLLHVNDRYNLMGTDWNFINVNGSTWAAYVGEDATSGAQVLYGSAAREDVSAVHWKYHSANGEYSRHQRTVVYDMNGNQMDATFVNAEPHFRVTRGGNVFVEFTLENNGALAQIVAANIYVSTNSTITTGDTLIGSTSAIFFPTPDAPSTQSFLVTIPAWLAEEGNYWIGVILDPGNALAEADETNNATYVPIRVNRDPPIFADSFERTTGLGASWSVAYGSYSTDGMYAVSGAPPVNGNWASVVPSIGRNDYSVVAGVIIPTGSSYSGVVARSSVPGHFDSTLYAAQISTDGSVNLYRRNDWTWTRLATQAAGVTANTYYTLKLLARDTSPVHLEVWLDGVLRLSYDDSAANRITGGVPGIENYNSGVRYDYFEVYEE